MIATMITAITITIDAGSGASAESRLRDSAGSPSRPHNLKEVEFMKYSCILVALCLSLYSFAGTPDTPKSAAATTNEVTMGMIAKIKVGDTTGAQIKELLGTPWRTNNYGDCNVVDYQETWEYLGHDADGRFKISIEFDEAGIARIVAKTPARGPVVVLAAAPKPGTLHQH